MVLLSIIGVMTSKGLTQVIRARDVVYEEQTRWRNIAMAWARMGEDVTTIANGIPQDMSELGLQGQATSARWAVWGSGGGVLPVQYALRGGRVVRTIGASLTTPKLTTSGVGQLQAPAEVETPLLSGVKAMALSYLDEQGAWHAQWPIDGTPDTRLRALRVSVTLDDGRDVTRIFALP